MSNLGDGVDNDCDGAPDNGLPTSVVYTDNDGDGYGGAVWGSSCGVPSGTTPMGGDCDDNDSSVTLQCH